MGDAKVPLDDANQGDGRDEDDEEQGGMCGDQVGGGNGRHLSDEQIERGGPREDGWEDQSEGRGGIVADGESAVLYLGGSVLKAEEALLDPGEVDGEEGEHEGPRGEHGCGRGPGNGEVLKLAQRFLWRGVDKIAGTVNGEEIGAVVGDDKDDPDRDEGGGESGGHGFAEGAAVGEELGAGGFVAELLAVDGDEENSFPEGADSAEMATVRPGEVAGGEGGAVDGVPAFATDFTGGSAEVVAAEGAEERFAVVGECLGSRGLGQFPHRLSTVPCGEVLGEI